MVWKGKRKSKDKWERKEEKKRRKEEKVKGNR